MFKRLFAVMLAVVMIISIAPVGLSVFAEDLTTGQIGNNVFYSFDSAAKTLYISGTGAMTDFQFGNYSPFFKNAEIKSIIIESGVTHIGSYAFPGVKNVNNICIPDSVKSTGQYAFGGCSALKSIIIPDSVTQLGNFAFNNCGIEHVDLPDSIKTVPWGLFCNCTNLKSFEFNNSIEVISSCMFENCTSLESVKLTNNISSVVHGAFRNCTALKTVYYTGTPEEFAEISVDSDDNQYFKNASVVYVDSDCEHNYELTATVEPTCDVRGYKEYTCSICGKSYKETTAPALGHNFGEYIVTIKPTCIATGENVRYCSVCGKADYAQIPELDIDHGSHIPGQYQVIKNPTVNSPGMEAIYCTRCETYYNQRAIPKLNPDLVISISLSSSKEVLLVGETSAISATVTPENTENKNVIWTSSDTSVAEVDNGIITAIAPGAAVIIAETEDGGYKDFCLVQVFSVNAQNGAQIDSADGFIYGLAPKLDSVADYLGLDDESVSLSYSSDVIGTGTKVYVKQGSTLISEYQVVIFGDVNGDGIYDGQDAFIVNCLANGALTREQVGEAKYLAADCNHDGEVNASDVLILEQAGLLLANVDQSKDDYIETDAYAEYLDLIDQTPTIDETPEAPTEPEAPSQPSLFEKIVEFIRNIINFIRSIIVK